MNQLEKLTYRKESSERLMSIWSKGMKVYTEFIDACKEVAKDKKRSDYDRKEAEKNILDTDIPLKHFITSWKLTKREYENHILPEIEKIVSEEDKKSMDFKDMTTEMARLAQNEIFADTSKRPDNVELIEVNESIKSHIKLVDILISESVKKRKASKDSYEKAKLDKAVFDLNLLMMFNEKRLQERLAYYSNQFLPQYTETMKEADKFLPIYLKRAEGLAKLDIDIKLAFVLKEYEKNKDDREKVWLFYTALKSRVNEIMKEMRKNKGSFRGYMHLAEKIDTSINPSPLSAV